MTGVSIAGIPTPKGSLKCVAKHAPGHRANLQEDHRPGQTEWRAKIVAAGAVLRRDQGGTIPAGTPVEVNATLTMPRPKSHYRTGRNAHLLRPGAPLWPCLYGSKDDDKLGRLLLDGLQDAKVFEDDAQVCRLYLEMCYPDTPGAVDALPQPGALIRVYRIDTGPQIAPDSLPVAP